MRKAMAQLNALLAQGLKVEAKNLERLVSPLLLAATLLVLFAFAVGGGLDQEALVRLYVAETYLTAFLALQISFARAFEPDTQDKVYDLLRTYPINPFAWFLGKYLQVLATGAAILLPTMAFAVFFHGEAKVSLSLGSVAIALLALVGLAALGAVLSLMTMGSSARQILYPILYFPLTTPVLLAAVEATRSHVMDGVPVAAMFSSWLGLLLIFDIIYLTLGMLIFAELVKPD